MRHTRLEWKPSKLRKGIPVAPQALANVRGGHTIIDPVAGGFITFGGYDTTDG